LSSFGKTLKNLSRYFLSFLFLGIAVYIVISNDYLALLKKVTVFDFTVSLLFCWLFYVAGGLQIVYVLKILDNINFKFIDIIAFPFGQSLWGYIIPKGGILYLSFIIRSKYNVGLKNTLSISLFGYFVSFIFCGITGLIYSYKFNYKPEFVVISLLFLLSPLIFITVTRIFKKVIADNNGFWGKIKNLFYESNEYINSLWKNPGLIIGSVLIYMLRLICISGWYYFLIVNFNFNYSYFDVILISLLTEFLEIVRIIPGNFGLQELANGGLFYLIGNNFVDGVFISLYTRLIILLLTFSLGLYYVHKNSKHFTFKEIKNTLLNFRLRNAKDGS
jgi:uncharacterized membrane protein YbhN (UPF0104 family)